MKPENQNKKPLHKIRTQLIAIMLGLLVVYFILMELSCYFLMGRYYQKKRINTLTEVYENINTLADTSDDFSSEINRITAESNIQILVTNADFNTSNTNSVDYADLAARLFGYYTGFIKDTVTTLKQADNYVLQISEDSHNDLSYLEMWGQLDDGEWFLIRTPMENMKEAVNITCIFVGFISIVVLGVGVAITWYMGKRMSEPIIQLTALSKRMADQDFSVSYEGHVNNEIDILGENFNTMSRELEECISELKAANVELKKDNEKKTEIDEMRKEFLNNVSHELKTPIALIQGYAEGLKDGIAEDPESRDFYCDVIVDEAQKMNIMVRKLLTLNQLEFGQDPVVMERFDLCELIKGTMAKMNLVVEQKNAAILFEQNEPIWAWGDEFKIEEVVTNFLSNALNHVDYEKKIEIRIKKENGIITTSVFNTGDPIPEEDLDKLWIKFYKVDKARTREYGGSGIGLSIVKAIMDGHGQKCGVTNYSNGVAFWFTLEGDKTPC